MSPRQAIRDARTKFPPQPPRARNAQAHIKAAIIGPSETIPVENAELQLGTWQGLMLLEFDGPRRDRKIAVRILPGA